MEMDDAELLHKFTFGYIANATREVFMDIKDKLTWKQNEVILDVGCGPGDMAANVLPQFIPEDAKIVSVDISENQINLAKKLYSNTGITFDLMDITDKNLWTKWKKEAYDKLFCIFVMHRIENDRIAYENMYNLLKPGGEIVVTSVANHTCSDIIPYLAKIPKYSDYAEVLSKMNIHIKPRENYFLHLTNLFKSIGFEVVKYHRILHRIKLSDKQHIIDMMHIGTPLPRKLPKKLVKEAIEDAKNIIRDNPIIEEDSNGMYFYIDDVIIVARKPI